MQQALNCPGLHKKLSTFILSEPINVRRLVVRPQDEMRALVVAAAVVAGVLARAREGWGGGGGLVEGGGTLVGLVEEEGGEGRVRRQAEGEGEFGDHTASDGGTIGAWKITMRK